MSFSEITGFTIRALRLMPTPYLVILAHMHWYPTEHLAAELFPSDREIYRRRREELLFYQSCFEQLVNENDNNAAEFFLQKEFDHFRAKEVIFNFLSFKKQNFITEEKAHRIIKVIENKLWLQKIDNFLGKALTT